MTRPNAQDRGYGWRWQKARDTYLRAHPWCVFHMRKGERIRATVVDHIKAPRMRAAIESQDASAIRTAPALFWDKGNWQGLCAHCHNSIKQSHESGGGKAACDEDGLPSMAGHHWNAAPETK